MFTPIFSRRSSRDVFLSLHAEHLAARYERVRRPRKFDRDPAAIRNVFVLSRVTLGADVAITSVMLDAAKQAFPNAQICFVGPQKAWELFAADPRLSHIAIAYGRGGTLDDRLSIWHALREAVCKPNSIVIDPDSRLTQLGLLPICPEEDYYFFESRSYGGDGDEPLSVLARRWMSETFGAADARPYIHTGLDAAEFATTVSFGVGENPAKRVPDPFEEELLAAAAAADSDRQRRGRRGSTPSGTRGRTRRSGHRDVGRFFRGFRRAHPAQPLVCWLRLGRRTRRGGLRRPDDQHLRRVRFRAHVPTVAPNWSGSNTGYSAVRREC